MLLAIDIGNTTLTSGVFSDGDLQATWRLSTDAQRTSTEYGIQVLSILKQNDISIPSIEHAVISSVVPPLTAPIQQLCREQLGCDPLVIEPGVRTGIRILTDNPKEVGADRIVNAAAAHQLHTGTKIIIDFGTATTIDVVSGDGDYVGGSIAPGIEVSMEALHSRAAKLPRIELKFPPSAVGKNTIHAMQSGLMFGYMGLIEGIVKRMLKELDSVSTQVIATGGLASIISVEADFIDVVENDLTLYGMHYIHTLNK
ncbi:MAG: type III pantothenate kinase [SAR202 cluster bacterium]|nr:type III pantothenate kinase [SAR202 cluster bacterium]